MIPAHEPHAHTESGLETLLPLVGLALVATIYLVLAGRRTREPRGWSGWRSASFLSGLALLAFALTPQLSLFPPGDFRGHMNQHLLIGMYAPLGLVLGAPVTLLLRSIPPQRGRVIGRVLRSRPAHLIANPLTALILNLGGLAALYFTPLYGATTTNPVLHHAVHAHFLAAGYLFAWVIGGPDPAPRRPSVPARLVVLGVAIAGHAILSQLLYAGALVQIDVPAGELRGAGDLMYYGGDIAELLLALALVTTWRTRRQTRQQMPSLRTTASHDDHRPVEVDRPVRASSEDAEFATTMSSEAPSSCCIGRPRMMTRAVAMTNPPPTPKKPVRIPTARPATTVTAHDG
jgi:putative membrane protein|nr:cytochrome c oxidase assembly protein [Knoellia sp. DB2414S]